MKKTFLIFLFLFIWFPFVQGQIVFSEDMTFTVPKYSDEELGCSDKVIYYEFTFVKDPKNRKIKNSNLTVLQIGDDLIKFTDVPRIQRDSLNEVFSQLKSINSEQAGAQASLFLMQGFGKVIFKEPDKDYFLVRAGLWGDDYEYDMEPPKLDWRLVDDEKKILNWNVKKAELTYGGRNWIAWYAEDLPIPFGPYIFGGLPGLILEIYDKENNFRFEIKSIESKEVRIYKRTDKKITKTSKEKFLQIEKSFYDNPSLFRRSFEDMGVESLPYNPIEYPEK